MAAKHLWTDCDLFSPPEFRWITPPGRQAIGELLYTNEPYRGQATEVFARVMLPDAVYDPGFADRGPVPAMVCVHGGGGQSFYEWANQWAARGYAAISMDLGGRGADATVRLPNSGPEQGHPEKFADFLSDPKDCWCYHTPAAVVRATSLLASLPEVDEHRIGLTGISWGGYLACIVAGLDPRLKYVAPVYGCGFLTDRSCWFSNKDDPTITFTDAQWRAWDEYFDPKHFLKHAAMPMHFVTGSNDFAYPIDSWQKSTELPTGPLQRSVRIDLMHGHQAGWNPIEIGIQADHVLKQTTGLVRITDARRECNQLIASFKLPHGIRLSHATLHVSEATDDWANRKWSHLPGEIEGNTAIATLPDDLPGGAFYFLNLTDQRNAVVSSPVFENR